MYICRMCAYSLILNKQKYFQPSLNFNISSVLWNVQICYRSEGFVQPPAAITVNWPLPLRVSHRSTSCVQLKSARRVMDLVLKDVLVIDGELFLQIIHNSYLNSGQRHKNSLMSLITALLKTAWLLPQFHVTAWRCLNNEKAELFIKKDPFPISVAKWRMHEVGQDDDPVRQQIWTVIERCLASD